MIVLTGSYFLSRRFFSERHELAQPLAARDYAKFLVRLKTAFSLSCEFRDRNLVAETQQERALKLELGRLRAEARQSKRSNGVIPFAIRDRILQLEQELPKRDRRLDEAGTREGICENAMNVFTDMQRDGINPNKAAFDALLSVYSSYGSIGDVEGVMPPSFEIAVVRKHCLELLQQSYKLQCRVDRATVSSSEALSLSSLEDWARFRLGPRYVWTPCALRRNAADSDGATLPSVADIFRSMLEFCACKQILEAPEAGGSLHMSDSACVLDHITNSHLLAACVTNRKLSLGLKLLELMSVRLSLALSLSRSFFLSLFGLLFALMT